jgi:hypothetical protein
VRKLIILGTLFATLPGLGGCGSKTGPANPPSEADIRRDEEEQKKVELEEQGTPIKKGQARRSR